MNQELFLLKMGEIVLKGLNRRRFEERLMGNLQRRLHPYGRFRAISRQSIVYVEPLEETCDLDGAWESMKQLFGIVGLSRAKSCEKNPDAFFQAACAYLDEDLKNAKSFKVESKRSDKTFPMTSIELSQYVGGLLSEAYPHLKVDVHNPELIVHLEVRDFAGYVHANPEPGAGGLPVGVGGRAVALLSGGIDSPVACYMMAKRGLALEMVHFFSYPYTSNEAKEKVLELASLLTGYCGRLTVNIVPFTGIQEELRRSCQEVEWLRSQLKEKEAPDLEQTEKELKEQKEQQRLKERELRKLYSRRETNQQANRRLQQLTKEREELRKRYQVLNTLSRTANGSLTGTAKIDLESYMQRQYFQHMIRCANRHLERMAAGQFLLKCRSMENLSTQGNTGLDLDVYSLITGKVRDVKTLSGGESFMAALALALGMTDVITQAVGAVHIDTLFIDEGFGSLDENAREQAIRILQGLSGGSRLVGIISHVTELKEQIEQKLVVTKGKSGSKVEWK